MSLKWSSACHYLASFTDLKIVCLHLMNKAVTFSGFFFLFSMIKSIKYFSPQLNYSNYAQRLHTPEQLLLQKTSIFLTDELHWNQLAEKRFDVKACYSYSPKLKGKLLYCLPLHCLVPDHEECMSSLHGKYPKWCHRTFFPNPATSCRVEVQFLQSCVNLEMMLLFTYLDCLNLELLPGHYWVDSVLGLSETYFTVF